jgi:MFS family permease
MVLIGVGVGIALNPVLLAATSGTAPSESGLASGLISTAGLLGGALGLATLTSTAATHTSHLLRAGVSLPVALNDGYHLAFAIGAGILVVAPLIGLTCLRGK